MPQCVICSKELSDLETYGSQSQPMCWEHWWDHEQKPVEEDGQDYRPAAEISQIGLLFRTGDLQ